MKRRAFIGTCGVAALSTHKLWAAEPRRIRVGLIGAWHGHAAGKLQAMRDLDDTFEVVGIAESDPALRREHTGRGPFAGLNWMSQEELVSSPGLEAVVIETDINQFVPTALRCAQAGKHIHLEKPAGPDLDPFRALIDLCRDKGLILQMGYMFRYNPAFQFAFRAVREGWLGHVYEVHGIIGKVIGPEDRREWARFKGGSMFELGSHLVDAAVAVLGPPTRVHGFCQHTREDGFADSTLAVLEYPKATATIRSAAVDVEGFARRQFTIAGDRGGLAINPLEPPQLTLTLAEAREGFVKGQQAVPVPKSAGRYHAQFNDFARMIRKQTAPEFTLAHDLAVHEALLGACGG